MTKTMDQITREFQVAEYSSKRYRMNTTSFDLQRTTMMDIPLLCVPDKEIVQEKKSVAQIGKSLPRFSYAPLVIRDGCTAVIRTSAKYRQTTTSERRYSAQRRGTGRPVLNFAYYVALIMTMIGLVLYNLDSTQNFYIFGYSAYSARAVDVYGEIPQGSLVIFRQTDPNSIALGDDVAFVNNSGKTVSRRVVEIIENQGDATGLAFRTKGTEGQTTEIVDAENVMGVVQTSIPTLGGVTAFLSDNSLSALRILGVLCLILLTARLYHTRPDNGGRKSYRSEAAGNAKGVQNTKMRGDGRQRRVA